MRGMYSMNNDLTTGKPNESAINHLIEDYYDHDKQLKSIKKICDNEKETIKNYYLDAGIDTLEVNNIKCSVSTSYRQTINTESCIQILNSMVDSGKISAELWGSIIKMQPYVDEDALEKAIYNNQIDAAELANCIDSKPVHTVRIGLKRAKKE